MANQGYWWWCRHALMVVPACRRGHRKWSVAMDCSAEYLRQVNSHAKDLVSIHSARGITTQQSSRTFYA